MTQTPPPLPTTEKVNTFRYLWANFDSEGWCDTKISYPIPFDLVTVQTSTGKKVAGWWNKSDWKGLRLKKADEVIKWKRRKYEHIS